MLRFIVAQKEAKSQKKVTLGWQNVIILDYAEGENTDRSKAQNKNQTQAIQQYTTTYEQKKRYTTTFTKKNTQLVLTNIDKKMILTQKKQ